MDKIKEKLENIKSKGLYRDFKYLQSCQRSRVTIDGREILLLGSNNYLGLSDNPLLKELSKKILDKYGLGAGGSRLTTGTYDLNKKLEEKIASFKNTESALTFSTGYMANVGVISALCDRKWVIFSDKLNHASIVDGCILSGAKIVRYKHCNMDDLRNKIKIHKGEYNLIVTDGVFSMDGDLAPLDKIAHIGRKHSILTMVDDAHGLGVLGEHGRGTPSHFNVSSEIDIHVGTLSKAIPSIGGYVAGKKYIIDYIRNSGRSFIFSTGLPPVNLGTALESIDIIKNSDEKRKYLLNLASWLKENLIQLGFQVPNTYTPIIPIIIGDPNTCTKFSNYLLEEGIYVNAIRPPTVPKNTSRLRISLMATHTYEDLEYVIDKLKYYGKKLNII
ncbi:MAG: 8-amino-7-oxononanoate synthase [Anaeromicrobium sp.]|jgi:8-amino-7-oxononanoate synthase|uniref:8-amino-7-oxononanoate synthase n=1 Tax=Anaeromicrobium sp. TaxID=1929132 RepID=UPI0025FD1337|nr:8-amino-7-oxononanoate synthase [Anaeromicrobium sp.]MCT4593537.1 8-amino-7-oxononanoate synthase [Anaeromicrobium sp.]